MFLLQVCLSVCLSVSIIHIFTWHFMHCSYNVWKCVWLWVCVSDIEVLMWTFHYLVILPQVTSCCFPCPLTGTVNIYCCFTNETSPGYMHHMLVDYIAVLYIYSNNNNMIIYSVLYCLLVCLGNCVLWCRLLPCSSISTLVWVVSPWVSVGYTLTCGLPIALVVAKIISCWLLLSVWSLTKWDLKLSSQLFIGDYYWILCEYVCVCIPSLCLHIVCLPAPVHQSSW